MRRHLNGDPVPSRLGPGVLPSQIIGDLLLAPVVVSVVAVIPPVGDGRELGPVLPVVLLPGPPRFFLESVRDPLELFRVGVVLDGAGGLGGAFWYQTPFGLLFRNLKAYNIFVILRVRQSV